MKGWRRRPRFWRRWLFALGMSYVASVVLLQILDDLPYEGAWLLLKAVAVVVVSIGVGELAERTYDQFLDPPPKSKGG